MATSEVPVPEERYIAKPGAKNTAWNFFGLKKDTSGWAVDDGTAFCKSFNKAVSTPSKLLFSQSGKIVTLFRASLKPNTVLYLVIPRYFENTLSRYSLKQYLTALHGPMYLVRIARCRITLFLAPICAANLPLAMFMEKKKKLLNRGIPSIIGGHFRDPQLCSVMPKDWKKLK